MIKVMSKDDYLYKKGFLQLLQSVDAFFPIGAFTLSNGLEDFVLKEDIRSEKDLEEYIQGLLFLLPYGDLGLAFLAYEFSGNKEEILELDHLAAAMKSAREIRDGSSKMCSRYLKVRKNIGDMGESLLFYQKYIDEKKALGCFSIAIGLYGAQLQFPVEELLTMYCYSLVSQAVNNAVKLVPLSQMEGQKILSAVFVQIGESVQKAMTINRESLGVSGCAFELHCMNHEYLYSRQYMS